MGWYAVVGVMLVALACGAPQGAAPAREGTGTGRAGPASGAGPGGATGSGSGAGEAPRAGGPAAAAPAATAPAVPVRDVLMAVSSISASNLVQLVGQDYGIYEQHGFRVTIQQFRSNIIPAALTSNQVDYSTAVDSALRLAATGVGVKVVAVNKSAPTFSLIARNADGVASLRGRTIGTTSAAGSNYYALKRLLEAHGVGMHEVNTVALGNAPALLQNLLAGLLDSGILSAPHVFEAYDNGFRSLAFVPDHVRLGTVGLSVSDEAIAARREEIKRMIVAQVEIIEYMKANPDRPVESLMKAFDVSREVAERTWAYEASAFIPDPRPSLEDIDLTIREEIELGHLPGPIPYQQMVALDLTEEALALARERAGRR